MFPNLFIGTWQADVQRWPHIQEDKLIEAIEHSIDMGLRAFDTAEIYGMGYSEQVLGRAVGKRRDMCFIASKVFAHNLSKENVVTALENSLKALKTDYLDLYQIHWPSGSFNSPIVPVKETLEAMLQLQEQGKNSSHRGQ